MVQSSAPSAAASQFRTTARRNSGTMARARTEGYTPEQVFAGAAVVGFLSLSLFCLVLWREVSGDCWEMHSANRGCATSSADADRGSWSPGGVGSIPKSQLLR